MITITLVAGAALVGFANGLLVTSSSSLGNAVVTNINQLGEREVIVFVNFGGSAGSPTPVTNVWVFNNGQIDLNLQVLLISGLFEYTVVPCNTNSPTDPACNLTVAIRSGSMTVSTSSGTALCSTNSVGTVESPLIGSTIKHGNDPSNPTEFVITFPNALTGCPGLQFAPQSSYSYLVIGAAGSQASLPNVLKS
jgi:hypothetical protein